MKHLRLSLLVGLACWCFAERAVAVTWHAAELWEDLPGESVLRVYMYNVTNRDEFLGNPKEVKPILQEVGPYVYKVQPKKTEASLQLDDKSVRFRQQKWYQFDPEASEPRTEEDEFNIVNMQLLIYGTRITSLGNAADRNCINWLTESDGEEMIRKNTVRDILFNGMESEVYVEREDCLINLNGISPPGFEEFEGGRYSYFKNRNGSDHGELRIQSTPPADYGQIVTLDRSGSVSYWNESEQWDCNGISGTSDGSVFPPSSTGGGPSMLFAYLPELCRAVILSREGSENENYAGTGIQAARYILGDTFLNYSREHDCWCTDANCLLDGALDIQSCTLGAPYAISQPVFRNADPTYAKHVDLVPGGQDGLIGGEDEPSSWIVEPTTGTVLESKRRFQLNIRVGALKTKVYFRDFPEFLFPVLWMEETYKLDDESVQSLKSALDGDGGEPEPEDPTTTTNPPTTTQEITTTAPSPTTTLKPTDPDPNAGQYLTNFNELHNDIENLGRKILFSTLAIILLLLAILVLSCLALGVRLRKSQRRLSQIQSGPVQLIREKQETVPYATLN